MCGLEFEVKGLDIFGSFLCPSKDFLLLNIKKATLHHMV